jgi:hypothetical protein
MIKEIVHFTEICYIDEKGKRQIKRDSKGIGKNPLEILKSPNNISVCYYDQEIANDKGNMKSGKRTNGSWNYFNGKRITIEEFNEMCTFFDKIYNDKSKDEKQKYEEIKADVKKSGATEIIVSVVNKKFYLSVPEKGDKTIEEYYAELSKEEKIVAKGYIKIVSKKSE